MKKLESSLKNMLLVLTGVTVVSVALLAYVNQLTKGPIARAEAQALSDAVRAVVPGFDNDPIAEKKVQEVDGVGYAVYPATKGGTYVGAAVEASAMGFELVADIRRGESPYFSQLSMGSVRIRSILKAFESAAEEFVSTGSVSAETVGIAERPIAESDSAYSKHTVVFWKLKRSGSGAGKSVRKKI